MRIAAIVVFFAAMSALGRDAPAGKSAPSSAGDKAPLAARPSPPDLTGCTRIEVKYYPYTLMALGLSGWSSILTADEMRYLESLKTIVVNDPNRIKAFAKALRSGSYEGSGYEIFMQRTSDVACYRGEAFLAAFSKHGLDIHTDKGHWFRYKRGTISALDLTPELNPFEQRGACARNLWRLGMDLRTMSREGTAWPAPHEWSDVLFHRRIASPTLLITDYSKAAQSIGKEFTCPGAGEGKCHYAMNPACKPDSPPDMVLLFETNAGWNQSGGPELFTFAHHDAQGGLVPLNDGTVKFVLEWSMFDHHNPKGGLILLNDGTVKSIRTDEELKQLRWK